MVCGIIVGWCITWRQIIFEYAPCTKLKVRNNKNS